MFLFLPLPQFPGQAEVFFLQLFDFTQESHYYLHSFGTELQVLGQPDHLFHLREFFLFQIEFGFFFDNFNQTEFPKGKNQPGFNAMVLAEGMDADVVSWCHGF